MEVIATIGFATAIIQTIDVVARTIDTLRKIQARWKTTEFTICQLIGQLGILKAALNQISSWVSGNVRGCPPNHQLTIDLEASIESCHTLVSFMEDFISHLGWDEGDNLSFQSKAKALLLDARVKDCQSHLNHQATALNLLLTALNCQSLSKQNEIMESSQTRHILGRVKDDSSSLIALKETSSFYSSRATETTNSSLLDRKFSFDSEILRSQVYQGQIRSLFRRALSRRKTTHNTHKATPRRFIYDCGIYIQDASLFSVCRARFDTDTPANYILASVCSRLSLRLHEFPKTGEHSSINTMHYREPSISHYATPLWCLVEAHVDTRNDVKFNVVDKVPETQPQTIEDVLLFHPWQNPMADVGRRELVPIPQSSSLPPTVQAWKNVDVVLKATLLPSSIRKNLRFRASRIEPSTLGEGRYVDGMMVWKGASLLSHIHVDGQ